MPETTPSPREELKHNRLMAGLEIVESEATPPPADPPPAAATVEHALAPIQAVWDGTENRIPPSRRPAPARTVIDKAPRRLLVTLPGLLVLALVAAFASWVSAAPLWLTVGHGVEGTVTVTACDSSGCHGLFTAAEGGAESTVRVTGDAEAKRVGEESPARVTSLRSDTAYCGDSTGLWWRVGFGLGLLLACGFAVAAVSGAWRWHGRSRLVAVSVSLAAPPALFAVVFALSW